MNITSERNFKEYSFVVCFSTQTINIRESIQMTKISCVFPTNILIESGQLFKSRSRRGSLLYLNCFFYNINDKKHHMILFSHLHNENSEPLCGGKFTFSWVVALQQLSSTDSKITSILYSMIERNI